MKSTLLKATVLATAAIAMGALASPAAAKTLKYTFANASGSAYCDGLTISTTDKVAYAGVHTGSCLGINDGVGGFAVKIVGYGYIETALTYTDNGGGANAYIAYLDTKHAFYYLYQSDGTNWNEINSGPLLKGAPPASAKGGTTALHAKAGVKLDKLPNF